jgi:hypothetical protein
MTISFPISLSIAPGVAQVHLRAAPLVGVSFAPWSRVKETQEWPGSRWELDITVPTASRANARDLFAQIASLRGPVGSALIGDPESANPLGTTGSSSIATNGSSTAGAYVVNTTGGSGTLLKGSLIQLGSGSTARLHMTTSDATLGSATLDIWPSLRTAYTTGSTILLVGAKGKFMLNPTFNIEDAVDRNKWHQVAAIPFIEDLS